MSTEQPTTAGSVKLSDVLQAYFRLDAMAKKEIQAQVQRSSDPQTSQAERDRAEKALLTILRSGSRGNRAGPAIDRDERLTGAHRALRARIEKVEEQFASTLARLMAEQRLTQAQLAERIGVGQSAISMLLKRQCRPQRRTVGKLAEALSVTVDELWPGFSTGWRSGLL